jgi:hypothetical protein
MSGFGERLLAQVRRRIVSMGVMLMSFWVCSLQQATSILQLSTATCPVFLAARVTKAHIIA